MTQAARPSGGSAGPGGGRARGPRRPPPRQVEVVATKRLAPRVVAVTFGGESLATFDKPAPTAHIKLFLPEADGTLRGGIAGADGTVEWPEGRPTMRTYTPRRFDAGARTLEVWFVLHGDGPAARWAAQAEIGDRVAIGGPGGRFTIDPLAAQWWIGGDESAVPAIATLIEGLPSTATARVHVEADLADDLVALPEHPGIDVTWHFRAEASAAAPPGELLVEALRADDVSTSVHLWAGCEASAVRSIRRHALGVRALAPARVTTRGYWRLGESNHPDHDFGED